MKKTLIIIKKIFAIIISFIFGLFKKDDDIKKAEVNEEKMEISQPKITSKNKNEISREEETNSNIKKDNKIYEVKDIDKLNAIKSRLYKIEYNLRKDNDINSINKIKSEFRSVKDDIEYLDKKYADKLIIISNLSDVKLQINNCKKLLKYIEKDLDSVVIKKEDTEEINIKKEPEIITPNKKEQKIEDNNQEIREIDSKKDKMLPSEKNNILSNIIVLSEIIIEKPKLEKKLLINQKTKEERKNLDEELELLENIEENIDKYQLESIEEDIEEIIDKEEKIKKQDKNKKEKKQIQEKSNNKLEIKKESKDNIEKKVVELKYNKRIDNIIQELNKAIILTYEQRINIISNRSRYKTLVMHILINNNIRTARNIFEKSRRRLKLININIQKEKLNELFIKSSIDKIRNDTLYQIESLEREIKINSEPNLELEMLLEKINQIRLNINETIDYENSNIRKLKKTKRFMK